MGKLMIVAPHPDDEAVASGGLIAFATSRNWEVYALAMSAGNCRQLATGHTESAIRIQEFEAAQRRHGFAGKIAFIGDAFMKMDAKPIKELVDLIEDEIERFRPDIIVVPPRSSYDQDHRTIATACVTALRPRPRGLRHFVDVVLEADEPYWWRVDTERPTPNVFIPLSADLLEAKLELVRCYETQDRSDPFGRSTDNLKRYAGIYGAEIGEEFAEAYRILRLNGKLLW